METNGWLTNSDFSMTSKRVQMRQKDIKLEFEIKFVEDYRIADFSKSLSPYSGSKWTKTYKNRF